MRPLKLTMQGFGSYIQRNAVDFQRLGKNGLFLITGATGGGKTTILDAICFALYCRATGGRRSWEQMRSAGLDINEPTLIEFEFANGTDIYKFCRKRTMYMSRTKSREIKPKDEHSCYKLKDNEWQLIASGAETRINECAYRILGLDCEQFSKVTVLPQGEFRKLLLSGTKEKQAIFEKLFLTQKWSCVIGKVKEKKDAIQERLSTLTTQQREILAGEGVDSAEALEVKIEGCKEQLEQHRLAAAKAKEETERLSKLIAAIDDISAIDKKLNQCNSSIRLIQNEKAETEKRYSRLKEECNGIADLKKEISLLTARLAVMNEQKKQAEKLEQYKKMSDNAQKSLDEENSLYNRLSNEIEKKKNLFDKLTQSSEEIQLRLNFAPALITKLNELKKIDEDYKKLKTVRENQQSISEKTAALKKDLDVKLAALDALEHEKNELVRQKSQKMSSLLAQDLCDNEPCPVCGSLIHPAPAHICDLNAAEIQAKIELIEQSITAQRESADTSNTLYIKACTQKSAIDGEAADLQKKCDGYNIYYRTVINDISRLESELKEINTLGKTYDKQKQELQALKKEITSDEQKAETVLKRLTELKSECKITAGKITEIEQSLPNGEKSADKISETILIMENKCIALKNELENLENEFSDVTQNLTKLNTKLNQLNETKISLSEEKAEKGKNIGPDDIARLDELKELFDRRLQLHENSLKQLGSLTGTIEVSQRSLSRIKLISNDFIKTEAEYRIAAHLADALSGRGSNTQRVQINAFVLCIMLDSIIMQANTYFTTLTDNRYRLSRSTEKSKGNSMGGLDIEIFDSFYGECRSVDTLSGGELFLASLSLALGLSDVVQGQSGGIHLDSIFIDEGFGSLDKETLDTAMKALISIKDMGRLVGIISHVSELKSMISTKIIVVSGKNGSKLKIEA